MKKFFIVLLGLAAAAPLCAQSSERDSAMTAIQKLYNDGQYAQAELEARRLAESISADDSARIGPEKMIAFSLVALGRNSSARDHFLAILRIDPTFDLDPLLTSPKILASFLEAKSSVEAQRRPPEESAAHGGASRLSVPTFRVILFPGWEQLYEGRTTPGYVFAGAGAITLGGGITYEILRASARRDYLSARTTTDIQSKYETYNRYYKSENFFFLAFALAYVASEIDVFTAPSPVDIQIPSSVSAAHGMRISLSRAF